MRTKSTVLSPLPLPVKTRGALWWKMRVAVKVMISRQGGMPEGSGKSMMGIGEERSDDLGGEAVEAEVDEAEAEGDAGGEGPGLGGAGLGGTGRASLGGHGRPHAKF